jgi:hypothetical protein
LTAKSNGSGADNRRSRTEVQALIEERGSTPPEWFEATPLNYPQSLDLAWPERPEGNWNNQKNVGQYVWDVINMNPGKWKEGVRFMHHLLSVHKDHPDVRTRAMVELGRMYHGLLQDDARGAYWWQKVGVQEGTKFTHQRPVLPGLPEQRPAAVELSTGTGGTLDAARARRLVRLRIELQCLRTSVSDGRDPGLAAGGETVRPHGTGRRRSASLPAVRRPRGLPAVRGRLPGRGLSGHDDYLPEWPE